MDVKENVIEILKELSGMDEVAEDSALQGDLGLDSLCMVTLLLELEDAFAIELDESDMNPYDLISAGDVIALAERYTGDLYETV